MSEIIINNRKKKNNVNIEFLSFDFHLKKEGFGLESAGYSYWRSR